MKYIPIALSAVCLLALTACQTTTQTTSGKDYVSKYASTGIQSAQAKDIDAEIAEIASVEPTLRFPARIGLAKIHNGEITNLSEEEVLAWTDASKSLGETFGEFIPVSALVAEMVYTPTNPNAQLNAREIVRKIRMGAARQHLDAVLIYETFSKTSERTLASSVANWTIIGAYFVPSSEITTVAYANALLLDVRNGYPYGTASSTTTEKELSQLADHWNKKDNLTETTQIAAAIKLVPEAVEMFQKLQSELSTLSKLD